MKNSAIFYELFLLIITIVQCQNAPTSEFDKFYWYNKNYHLLHHRMRHIQGDFFPKVKNVILFIGDGMGMTTITATRTLKRQISRDFTAHLTFDHFPATAMLQTDILNSQISESAASSTALFCGVKTNFESIGVDATVKWDACESTKSHTSSIISWAQEENLKTGLVFILVQFIYFS
jgi:alkaline phosphatase